VSGVVNLDSADSVSDVGARYAREESLEVGHDVGAILVTVVGGHPLEVEITHQAIHLVGPGDLGPTLALSLLSLLIVGEARLRGHSEDLTLSVAVTATQATLVSVTLEASDLEVLPDFLDLTGSEADLGELSVGELGKSVRHEWFL
jgi:hypothetical protein